MQKNPYERYKSVRVETASPKGLVQIAYDGIIDCLRKAKRSLEKTPRDIEIATNEIVRAQRIVAVLIDGLDLRIGRVAEMLGSFYAFLQKSLADLNFSKDIDKIDELIKLVNEIKSFWQQHSKGQKGEGVNEVKG